MGLNYRKRIVISSTILKNCKNCKKVYNEEADYCPECGKKLSTEKTTIYANIGKNGITSFSYKLSNGVTINSKNKITVQIAKGISYTI